MLKQVGIIAFGLVVVATSSSAFAQQAQRPLTRGIAVQASPAPVATRAITIEEKAVAAAPVNEISAQAKTEAPVVAEEAKPVEAAPAPVAPPVVEKPVVVEKPPVIVKEKAIVKVKPVERFAEYGYGYSPRYSGGYAHNCH